MEEEEEFEWERLWDGVVSGVGDAENEREDGGKYVRRIAPIIDDVELVSLDESLEGSVSTTRMICLVLLF